LNANKRNEDQVFEYFMVLFFVFLPKSQVLSTQRDKWKFSF
jgi:hypothetical protein